MFRQTMITLQKKKYHKTKLKCKSSGCREDSVFPFFNLKYKQLYQVEKLTLYKIAKADSLYVSHDGILK